MSDQAATPALFHYKDSSVLFSRNVNGYETAMFCIHNSVWVLVTMPSGFRLAVRCAYSPSEPLEVLPVREQENGVTLKFKSSFGIFQVTLDFPASDCTMLHYKSVVELTRSIHIP